MKGISGLLVAAVALALLGVVLAKVGFLERDMAQAQANVTTMNYDGVEETFDQAERYYEYGSHLPWVGNGPLNDVRARRASMHYWQKSYATSSLSRRIRSAPSPPTTPRCSSSSPTRSTGPGQAPVQGQGDDDAGARRRDQRLSGRAQEHDAPGRCGLQLRIPGPAARRSGQGQAQARARRPRHEGTGWRMRARRRRSTAR